MSIVFRVLGGLIMAFSFFYLLLPNMDNKAVLGILLIFIGFYMATKLVFFDFEKDKS